jgi:hypothetical protein
MTCSVTGRCSRPQPESTPPARSANGAGPFRGLRSARGTGHGARVEAGRRSSTFATAANSLSHPDVNYARTRSFYEALGFIGLEETTAFWGEANPCLIMVKVLG